MILLLLAGLVVLVATNATGLFSLAERTQRTTAIGGTIAGALLAAVPAVRVLVDGVPIVARVGSALPGGDWVMTLDPLAAFFVLVVLFVGGACLVYGVSYDASPGGAHGPRSTSLAGAGLVTSLVLVVTAGNITLFMAAWELMAITSFVLIMTDHTRVDVRRAGLLYLILTHTATLALFVMFALWTRGTPDWTFASLAAAGLPKDGSGVVLLLCALAGFGMKAGLVPAHFWLPPAHAAAPSHVSAIMSGLVIKTGIYGLLRVVLLAGPPPAWWGWALLIGGAVSAVAGVLWALVQHDLKRLLAFHSVENVGIIAMGMGLGALATTHGHPTLALLGYGAALLHTANHAIFKALLFLAAGAVQRATHTRQIEALGGLARRMPQTWWAFLIGAAAIVGLPPLNGFVSEWLLFAGLLGAASTGDAMRVAVLGAPALAIVGGLALACFTKVAGVVFLGHARSPAVRDACEVGAGLRAPAWALAAACVAIGFGAVAVVGPVLAVAAPLAGRPFELHVPELAPVLAGARGVTLTAAGLLVVVGVVALARRSWLGGAPVRADATWDCAWPDQTARMQYTASSYAAPLVRAFGAPAGVHEHRGATVYHSIARDLVFDGMARPAWNAIHRWALFLRPMQQGRLNVYLIYVVAALVALLAYGVLSPPVAP